MRLSEPIRDPVAAAGMLRRAIPRGLVVLQECLVVLVLDSQHRVIGRPVLAHIGTMDNVEAHPRDIFREAIRRNAKGLIVGHNHPSGELAPSTQDKDLAVRIDNGGKLLGIQVLDHIVVGRRGHRSMSAGEWS